jgi:hypothetical protein
MPDTSTTAPYQLMPPLSNEEFLALKEDIKDRGVAVAIEFDGDGNILDGHHRLRAYDELLDEGYDVPMYDQKIMHFENEEAKRDYVLALNLKRRHLTGEQKASLFARLRQPPFNMTLQAIARVANVGVGTVWRKLEEVPDDVRETLDQLQTIGKDGKTYPAVYGGAVERTIIPAEKALRDHTSKGYTSGDQSDEIERKFLIVITCPNEDTQSMILGILAEEDFASWDGTTIKAIMS